jgi:hypothetical protein
MRFLRVLCQATAVLAAVMQAPASVQGNQGPNTGVTVRGIVYEAGSNVPIPGAEVSIAFVAEEKAQVLVPPDLQHPLKTIKTDTLGEFSFTLDKFGHYLVRTNKAGYSSGGSGSQPSRSSRNVLVTSAEPMADVKLFLSRPREITGGVVDANTGKPIPDVRVGIYSVIERFGGRGGFAQTTTVTNKNGEFRASGLPPGLYVVVTMPVMPISAQLKTEFEAADVERVDLDYETKYWPGGSDLQSATPVDLTASYDADVGRIEIAKVRSYRVLVHAVNCKAGETVKIIRENPDLSKPSWKAPCAKDLLLLGFTPGTYRLAVVTNNKAARESAVVSLVVDRNVAIDPVLDRPVVISGAFKTVEESELPALSKAEIRMTAEISQLFLMTQPVRPDAKGEFQISGVPPVRQRLSISGLPKTHYIKEIRYNNAPISDNVVPVIPVPVQALTILLEDKPATISGSVSENDKPVAEAYVLLQKWPAPAGGMPPIKASADKNGRFSFSGLPPGTYRLIAVRSADEFLYMGPGALERAMVGATEVEVERGDTRQAAVRVRSLR